MALNCLVHIMSRIETFAFYLPSALGKRVQFPLKEDTAPSNVIGSLRLVWRRHGGIWGLASKTRGITQQAASVMYIQGTSRPLQSDSG